MTALQHLFPQRMFPQRMTAYVLTIYIFVFMRTIIVLPPPPHAHTFSPSYIASSRLFQRRFGNIFIRDPIILTPVIPQNLLGESFGFTFFFSIKYLSLATIKLSFR